MTDKAAFLVPNGSARNDYPLLARHAEGYPPHPVIDECRAALNEIDALRAVAACRTCNDSGTVYVRVADDEWDAADCPHCPSTPDNTEANNRLAPMTITPEREAALEDLWPTDLPGRDNTESPS